MINLKRITPQTILLLIILTAFLVRLYKINTPLADWHSWRQADTSAVTRNFIKYGFDLLHPRFDDLSNIPSGKDNPQGYRFVEFPIYNALTAIKYQILPIFSIEVWGRLLSMFASLGSLIFLYLLTKKYLGEKTALFSAFFFAFLPYNIYYSRVILPEPSLIFTSLASIYFLDKWLEKSKFIFWIFAVIFSASALLIKVTAIFLWPVLLYLLFKKYKIKMFIKPSVIFFIVISFIPILLWRKWMLQYPEGIPAFDWLLNGGNIRFRPAFFRWILYERLTKLILGYSLVPVLFVGFFYKIKKIPPLFLLWFIGLVFYVCVIARGNVQHDYYQTFLIPIICVFLGRGMSILLSTSIFKLNIKLLTISSTLLTLIAFYFSWQIIHTYYWINNPKIVEAGIAVNKLTPIDSKIIAPYGGDTTFLYQTNRQGWPQGFEIEDKIKKGANYYVNINVNDPETLYVMNKWKTVFKTNDYVIVKLN